MSEKLKQIGSLQGQITALQNKQKSSKYDLESFEKALQSQQKIVEDKKHEISQADTSIRQLQEQLAKAQRELNEREKQRLAEHQENVRAFLKKAEKFNQNRQSLLEEFCNLGKEFQGFARTSENLRTGDCSISPKINTEYLPQNCKMIPFFRIQGGRISLQPEQ